MSIEPKIDIEEMLNTEFAQVTARLEETVRDKENNLFNLYLVKISREYREAPNRERCVLLHHLQNIVGRSYPRIPPIIAKNVQAEFEPASARQVRESLGYTRKQTAAQIRPTLQEVTLYRYETGIAKVSPLKSSCSGYLLWLKERGYDPFSIETRKELPVTP